MQTFFIVSIGRVIKSNGGIAEHGKCICSFDSDLTQEQVQQVTEALGCANLHLCNLEEYKRDYVK
jgi:hypothetical protein